MAIRSLSPCQTIWGDGGRANNSDIDFSCKGCLEGHAEAIHPITNTIWGTACLCEDVGR